MSIFNNGIRNGCIEGDLPLISSLVPQDDAETYCDCGAHLETVDEIFSEECDSCFKKFVETAVIEINKEVH